MNNLIDFIEYKNQVRLYEEELVKSQIIEPVNEGFRNKINEKATIFVKQALSEEIEMGDRLNEQIKESIKSLKETVDKIQQEVDNSHPKNGEFFNKLKGVFNDIENASFSLMTLIGGIEINFADYVANATMANMVNYGCLFIPTRNIFLLKKSYKYFIGIIKNTIRKDLLMVQLNFDQFENTVLIQALDDDEYMKQKEELENQMRLIEEIEMQLIGGKDSKGKIMSKKDREKVSTYLKNKRETVKLQQKLNNDHNSNGYGDMYGNTYTKTLDQLKSFVLEDDQKYLEAIKTGMHKLALDEVDTQSYVELLIAAAEECAYEVSNAIHNNFLSMTSVFKLSNQRRLIELVRKDKEKLDREIKEDELKREKELNEEKINKFKKCVDEKGSSIFKKVTKPVDGDQQMKAYDSLNEIEFEDEKYDEKEILDTWFNMNDSKNWKKRKVQEKITPELKLRLTNVLLNEDSYHKYIDMLTNSLYGATGIFKYMSAKGRGYSREETPGFSKEKLTESQKNELEALSKSDNIELLKIALNLVNEEFNMKLSIKNIIDVIKKLKHENNYEISDNTYTNLKEQLKNLNKLKKNDYMMDDDKEKEKKGEE